MAEQHAIGRSQGQGVTGAFFPRQMQRAVHQLLGLNPAELSERPIGSLVAPNALAGREHGIAAIAFLVIAIILVAVNDDFIAHFPARDLGPDLPHHASRIRTGDMERSLVIIERRNGATQRRPDAVVIDTGCHHHNQHFVGIDLRSIDHFQQHGLIGIAVTLLTNHPSIHALWNMAQRRDLSNFIKVLPN